MSGRWVFLYGVFTSHFTKDLRMRGGTELYLIGMGSSWEGEGTEKQICQGRGGSSRLRATLQRVRRVSILSNVSRTCGYHECWGFSERLPLIRRLPCARQRLFPFHKTSALTTGPGRRTRGQWAQLEVRYLSRGSLLVHSEAAWAISEMPEPLAFSPDLLHI